MARLDSLDLDMSLAQTYGSPAPLTPTVSAVLPLSPQGSPLPQPEAQRQTGGEEGESPDAGVDTSGWTLALALTGGGGSLGKAASSPFPLHLSTGIMLSHRKELSEVT